MTADATPALTVAGLAKSFGANHALQGVDLTIAAGEIHALLGENGSGKSTLIKILSGFYRPDGGSVRIANVDLGFGNSAESYRSGARFVHQDLGLIDTVSVLDNLAIGTGFTTRFGTVRSALNTKVACADLARVGLTIDPGTLVGRLSPAVKTGVAIARATRHDPDAEVRLLILDEPTATLPSTEVDRLMEIVRRVASTGVGVLYVTHRLDEVFALAENVSVLRNGLKVATSRTRDLDHKGLVDLLVGDELIVAQEVAGTLSARADRPALTVRHLSAESVTDISVEFAVGQITGVAGITGSGRETLLGAIFGAVERHGEVVTSNGAHIKPGRPDIAMQHGLAFLPADRKVNSGLMDLSASENVAISNLRPLRRLWTMRPLAQKREALRWFDQLGVRPATAVDQPLASFSGGNQQKIMFGKWLRRAPAVFLLDEPSQGVDVGAKAVLHRQLVSAAADGAAVVFSSSDVDELAAICQRVVICRNGRITADLRGDDVSARVISRECLRTERERATSGDA